MLTTDLNDRIYDIVVIGAGGAGMMAAIEAKKRGFSVAVISKVHPLHSHTTAAQGGINAVFPDNQKDNWRWHVYDTIKGSDWLSDQDAVELLCEKGHKALDNLVKYGVEFDKNPDGSIKQKIYGGHTTDYGKGKSAERICSVKDNTGNAILTALYKQSLDLGVDYFEYHFCLKLLLNNHQCQGVVALNINESKIVTFKAPHTIIATGGHSQIYEGATSSNICTGDGNLLVWQEGLALQDMEFVQFHPTAINNGILITEAARAEGATLLNVSNERFMNKYAPKYMELAARDVVARAIATEIFEGRGGGENKDHVLLDLRHLSIDVIKSKLPNLYFNCRTFLKIDPSKELIPISPAAHYTMGGVPTDKYGSVIDVDNDKELVVAGLYAIGEAACISLHGANRLGCNSLLELIVYGEEVIRHICSLKDKIPSQWVVNDKIDMSWIKDKTNIDNKRIELSEIRKELQRVMKKYCGIFRAEKSLQIGKELIRQLEDKMDEYSMDSETDNLALEVVDYYELKALFVGAKASISSAEYRKESRGAHYRQDFPDRDDNEFRMHTITKPDMVRDVKIMKRQVRVGQINVDFFTPEQRKY